MNFSTIETGTSAVVKLLADVLPAIDPAIAPAVSKGAAIYQGFLNGVDSARAAVQAVQAGSHLTADQIAQIEADMDASDAKLEHDIEAAKAREAGA